MVVSFRDAKDALLYFRQYVSIRLRRTVVPWRNSVYCLRDSLQVASIYPN